MAANPHQAIGILCEITRDALRWNLPRVTPEDDPEKGWAIFWKMTRLLDMEYHMDLPDPPLDAATALRIAKIRFSNTDWLHQIS